MLSPYIYIRLHEFFKSMLVDERDKEKHLDYRRCMFSVKLNSYILSEDKIIVRVSRVSKYDVSGKLTDRNENTTDRNENTTVR